MMSTKRRAQLGLGAAGLVLIGSVAVLMAGESDSPAQGRTVSAVPLAGSQMATVSAAPLAPSPSLGRP